VFYHKNIFEVKVEEKVEMGSNIKTMTTSFLVKVLQFEF